MQAERWQEIELKSKHAVEHMLFIKNIYQNIYECECLLVLKWEMSYWFFWLQAGKKIHFRLVSFSHYLEMPINHLSSYSRLS